MNLQLRFKVCKMQKIFFKSNNKNPPRPFSATATSSAQF